jgi:hypothetical protein
MDKGSNDSNNFSAEDIRRYHAGEMSAREMHTMEKAALEDAFLADAIEGYTYTTDIKKDIEEIRRKLLEKETDKKIISISETRKSFYAPLKVAALALLVAGAGWVVYQFSLPKENDMALNKTELKQTDNAASAEPGLPVDGLTDTMVYTEKKNTVTAPGKRGSAKKDIADYPEVFAKQKTETIADQKNKTDVATVENQTLVSPAVESSSAGIRLSVANLPDSNNLFKGRIVNTEDIPVPYASISIPNLRKDVLSDAQGNFSINTPDSILKANVNAVGYLTNKLSLYNSQENHKVVLQASNNALREVVVTGITQPGKKETARLSAKDNKNNNVEPVGGFEAYNEYLLNNMKDPAIFTRQCLAKNLIFFTVLCG